MNRIFTWALPWLSGAHPGWLVCNFRSAAGVSVTTTIISPRIVSGHPSNLPVVLGSTGSKWDRSLRRVRRRPFLLKALKVLCILTALCEKMYHYFLECPKYTNRQPELIRTISQFCNPSINVILFVTTTLSHVLMYQSLNLFKHIIVHFFLPFSCVYIYSVYLLIYNLKQSSKILFCFLLLNSKT
jgi:hypothetical protein